MAGCPSCSAAVADGARFCSSCGAPFGDSSAGTVQRTSADRPPSSGSIDHGRFVPGTMFGTRYRIVALLGRGGMGEVFRADDLKLGQPVALKLLPRELAAREDRRTRLLTEVRIARQIAHPNVCRVYDVGEIDGEHFITMEYVTGEDLASLLQRIGRLPKDKGIEIARQICAGLAAAHERGILHRDLKPANIMLDERGKVRITDFGLAALSSDPTASAAEGTPAYMAPEQLAGKETTQRSDIYALGLVLYELFTGKRAFHASSLAEMREMREQHSLTDPSRIVEDIDPAVERVILRCLESDPRDRPHSAVAVAAALPGGDPLAAALAAGETPSPELLAVAGDKVGFRPSVAVPLLIFVILGAVAALVLRQQRHITQFVPLRLTPGALELKASEALRAAGYASAPIDSEGGFAADRELVNLVAREDPSLKAWKRLGQEQPSAIFYWYREADQPLEFLDFTVMMVTPADPPPRAGNKQVWVDPAGRLLHFRVVPEQGAEQPQEGARLADWSALFAAAGLDQAQFRPAAPRWLPPSYADARAAWEGVSGTGRPLRIEAASLRGRPVYFQLFGPWTRPEQMPSPWERPSAAALIFQIALLVAVLLGAVFAARRNLVLGRGDRRGALRTAFLMAALTFLMQLLHTTHTQTAREITIIVMVVSWALIFGGITWLLYLALEPSARRRWPHALIGWGKALGGRMSDPLVGREILAGSAAGVGLAVASEGANVLSAAAGGPVRPDLLVDHLSDMLRAFDVIPFAAADGLRIALLFTFLFFLLRVFLRREWLAAVALLAVGAVIFAFVDTATFGSPLIGAAAGVVAFSTTMLLLTRMGVLSVMVCVSVSQLIGFSVPAPLNSWYAYTNWVVVVPIAAIALFAFHTSLAGRRVFREALLET